MAHKGSYGIGQTKKLKQAGIKKGTKKAHRFLLTDTGKLRV